MSAVSVVAIAVTAVALYVTRGVLDQLVTPDGVVRVALLPPWQALPGFVAVGLLAYMWLARRVRSRADAGGSHIYGHCNFYYVRMPETDGVGAIHWMTDHADVWVSGLGEMPHPHLAWPACARYFHFRRAVDNDGGEACRWLPLRTASCRRDSAGAPSGRPSALGHDDATASAPACLHPRPRG